MKCRLCLYEYNDDNCVSLFSNNEETNWTKLIVKYLYLEVKQNDKYSTSMCKICLAHLEDFHNFFQSIEKRQKELQSELRNINKTKSSEVEIQIDEAEEPLFDLKYLVPETEIPIENPLLLVDQRVGENTDCEEDKDELPLGESSMLKETTEVLVEEKKKSNSRNALKRGQFSVKQISKKATRSCVQKPVVASNSEPNNRIKQATKDEKSEDELIAKHIQLKCEVCGESMETFKMLKSHFRKEHATDGFVICCDRRFPLRRLLLDHIQVHLNPDCFKCDVCNKKLKSRARLELHKVAKHSDRRHLKYACSLCQKRFPSASNLNVHMLVHNKERNHICEICSKGFKSDKYLKAHMQTHEETTPFVCDSCGREYRNKLSFERHVAEHEGRLKEPTDECPTCGKWFTLDGLQRHIKNHKLEDVECKLCGKILKSKGALRGHMDYFHRRQQVLTCTFCDKTFKRTSVFKEHIAMHTGQKDYKCPHCSREFRSKANMYAHIKKIHIEEWAQAQLIRFKGPNIQLQKNDEASKG